MPHLNNAKNIVEVRDISFAYGDENVLHGITNTGTTPMTFYWSKWIAKGFA